MKTALICHGDAPLTRQGLARWLASFSDLAGIVEIREGGSRTRQRLRWEVRRVGWLRMLDVAAFRLYYRAVLAARDRAWERGALATLVSRHPPLPATLPIHVTASPNRRAVQDFLETLAPDLVLARCKVLLKERIFSVPADGTFILHPGICPEYRNAHGCFWALVRDDLENVGATLLRIDRGIDTGPIYGYFRYPYDEVGESHVVIQHRTVLDNLDAIRERLLAVHRGEARPLDASGRPSGSWGQPWLSRYLGWKRRARRRARAAA